MKLSFPVIACSVALIVSGVWFIGIPRLERFLDIDSCLDMGHRWDYQSDVCDETIDPGQLSPVGECEYYGGEWDREAGVCVGAEGDPWPPSEANDPPEDDS